MDKKKVNYREISQERIVTIIDILEEIVRKIWIVILVAVICAGVLGGDSYIKSRGTSTSNPSQVLTDSEQQEVNEALLIYNNISEQREYLKESILVQVDAYNEDNVILQYYIDDMQENDLNLLDSYRNYISNGGLVADLRNNGVDIPPQYLSELISCISNFEQTTNEISPYTIFEQEKSNVFGVKIIHLSQEKCEKLAQEINECLEHYHNELSKTVREHTLSLTQNAYTVVVDKTLWTYKTDRVKNLQSAEDSYKDVTDKLSDRQKVILEKSEQKNEIVVDTENQDVNSTPTIDKKMVLIGGIGGALLACVIIALYYLLSGTIKKSDDIQYLYNTRILAEVEDKSSKNIIRKWLNNLFKKNTTHLLEWNEAKENLISQIPYLLKEDSGKNVLFLYEKLGSEEKDWLNAICDGLKENHIQGRTLGQASTSRDLFKELNENKSVIVIGKLRTTTYTELAKIYENVLEEEADVIGAITVH